MFARMWNFSAILRAGRVRDDYAGPVRWGNSRHGNPVWIILRAMDPVDRLLSSLPGDCLAGISVRRAKQDAYQLRDRIGNRPCNERLPSN